jgi:hypothetical protein
MVHVDHGKGRGGAFPEMDNAIWLKFPEDIGHKIVVSKIAGPKSQLPAISLGKRGETLFN